MKSLYKTPEIKVEELAKADVLCASPVGDQPVVDPVDNYTLLDEVWNTLTNLF